MAAAAASGEKEEEEKKLQERAPIRRTAWMLADFVVLFLLLALLVRRATAADAEERGVARGVRLRGVVRVRVAAQHERQVEPRPVRHLPGEPRRKVWRRPSS